MKTSGVARVSATVALLILVSPAVFAQDEGTMDHDEINDMIDDVGGGSNSSTMTGMDGGSPNTVSSTPEPNSMASVPATPVYNDFSTKASDFDDENDEDGGVDKEMIDSGEHESVSDRWNDKVPDVSAPPTPIPTGDKYNASFDKPAKKKISKKKSKKKSKIAKKSKKSKKSAKISKKSKKGKDRRVAGRGKGSSKKRYR